MRQWLACGNGVRRVRLGWAMLLWLWAGCVNTPRAESDLGHRSDAVAFSGLFDMPGATLELQAKNQRTGEWQRFGTARTRAQEPLLGLSGRSYFRYAASAVLPQAPEFWIAHPEQGRVEAQVRVAYGDRALLTFQADAENCGRLAHDRGVPEREALTQCAAPQGAFSRVFVASCGALGEACCPRTAAADSCAEGYACNAGVCEQPSYPVPLLRGYQIDLPLPPGYVLRDAWLARDDRANAPGSERPLLRDYRPEPGVERSLPHPDVARLRFDVGLWTPGSNRFSVRGYAVRGDRRRYVESPMLELDYALPRAFGLQGPGHFALPPENFPRLMRDCHGPHCKDVDGDGQNDLWENVLVQQLRPRLLFDSGDGLFRRRSDAVRVLSSVVPLTRRGKNYVLIADVVAFSRDYGHFGFFDHPGDTEAIGMLFRVDEHDVLSWVASAAKGHHCLLCAPHYAFHDQDFAEDGSPLVYVEQDKHGLWQSGRDCRAHAAFSCRGDRELRPSASNVGDFSPDGSRGLVDGLDGLAPNGPFAALAGVFPGDAIWSAQRSRVNGRFCGGSIGCSAHHSANQPGRVIAGILELFDDQLFGQARDLRD